MSRLKLALTISIAMLAAGMGDAQAAKFRFSLLDFGLFNGFGAPEHLTDKGHRIPAIKLGDDQGDDGDKPAIKPSVKPDGSPDWTSQEVDKPDNWSQEQIDQPQSDWQATTVTRPDPVWKAYPATP